MPSPFSKRLLAWYDKNARDLPWRDHPDPYAVWVSEIMLQQTQVETVIPYFVRWMKELPTIAKLAAATQQDVLTLWEGLGYYSRARNIHRAAEILVQHHDGKLPQDINKLKALPGIGSYTAAAIASFAFGHEEPVLDGNVRRVLSRVFNLSEPVDSSNGEKVLWQIAGENLPSGQGGDYNQAIMDLGSAVCIPKSPKCEACSLNEICQANLLGVRGDRPVKKPKKKIPHHTVTAAVFEQDDKVLIAQRPQNSLLGGMWEFPGGKQESGEDLESCLEREILEELGVEIQVGKLLGVYKHAYTHFRITLHAFHCKLNGFQPKPNEHSEIRWVSIPELKDFPMGKVDRQIATQLLENVS